MAFTLDVYVKATPERQRHAAAAVAALIYGDVEGERSPARQT